MPSHLFLSGSVYSKVKSAEYLTNVCLKDKKNMNVSRHNFQFVRFYSAQNNADIPSFLFHKFPRWFSNAPSRYIFPQPENVCNTYFLQTGMDFAL